MGLRLQRKDLLANLPQSRREDCLTEIQNLLSRSGAKVVVLDDDPTGTQTVHDIPVLTTWEEEVLRTSLEEAGPGFFLLTNSRAFEPDRACEINRTIGQRLANWVRSSKTPLHLVSRSDSTLRGHFPVEVEALASAYWSCEPNLGSNGFPEVILCPFFEAGGRWTYRNVHYMLDREELVPVAETPFAQDPDFGYSQSNLCRWVEEKTAGRIAASQVAELDLGFVRQEGPEGVRRMLLAKNAPVWVVNAITTRDVECVVQGILEAAGNRKQFLYRTGASFASALMGLRSHPPLSPTQLCAATGSGGLVVVGSWVPKTTEQLDVLLARRGSRLVCIELPVSRLLDSKTRAAVIGDAVSRMNAMIRSGQDVLLSTSRKVERGKDRTASSALARAISEAVVEVIRNLSVRPRFMVAKGGITSSDVATGGLGVKKAMVLGQALPGVPVWQLEKESRFPGLAYIVFPGNVGGLDALDELYEKLSREN